MSCSVQNLSPVYGHNSNKFFKNIQSTHILKPDEGENQNRHIKVTDRSAVIDYE